MFGYEEADKPLPARTDAWWIIGGGAAVVIGAVLPFVSSPVYNYVVIKQTNGLGFSTTVTFSPSIGLILSILGCIAAVIGAIRVIRHRNA